MRMQSCASRAPCYTEWLQRLLHWCLLTFQLTGSLAGAALAGFMLGLYPPASGLVVGGYSEIAYLMVMIAGLILLFEGGRWAYAGAVVCGISVLARSNFLLMPFIVVMLLVLFRARALLQWRNLRLLAIGTALFGLLPCPRIVRNYIVSGHFPIVSALEGEVLYGGNNPLGRLRLERLGLLDHAQRHPG